MQTLAALGLPAMPLPELSARAQLAIHCWNWCDGWHPERWPVFDALHPVDDWHALVELMQVIREQQRETERARAAQVSTDR